MCRWMRFPPGPWEGSCLDTEFVPWWAGLALDYCWEGLELSPRAVPDSTVKTEVCDLALEACTDGHVSCQVPWWTGMLSNYGREAVVVSGLPECLPAGPCACSTAVDGLRGPGAENGTLSGSLGAQLGLSLAGSLCQQDCGLQPGWIGAQLWGPFRICTLTGPGPGLDPVHRQLQSQQLRLRSVFLLPKAQVGLAPLDSLVYRVVTGPN